MPFDQTKTHSLADVINKLQALPTLPDTKRRDLISAITRTTKFLNRAPADLPTDAPSLRTILETIHPAQAGISAKSLANVKSNLAKALQVTRFMPRDLPQANRSAAWDAFFKHAGAKHQEWGLARFAAYCCSRGIDPQKVNDAVMTAFQSYLDARLLGKNPARLCKEMKQTWNGIVTRNTLSLATLTYAPNPRYRCRPLTDYPVRLQDEIADYLKWRSGADLFDINAPDKPLKPMSLRNTKAHLTQFLDAFVSSGVDPARLHSLTDVVTPENMRAGFTEHMKRRGITSGSGSLQNIAATLVVMARDRLKVEPTVLKEMIRIKRRVSTNPKGMNEKNSQRLIQFNDWENVIRILSLSNLLMDRAEADPASRISALHAMRAAALTILLSCPLRAKNLAGLDLNRHLMSHRNGTHTIYGIRIEGADVKNREAIEVHLTAKNSAMLHRYITKFRSNLTEVPTTALFPRASDGLPRTPSNFSGDLTAAIYRETGLVMNMHLFRHFGAKMYLDAKPGHYEAVRRLLKHRNVQTTIDFYAEMTSQFAFDEYSDILAKFGGRHH
ncbi:hypothetical protein A8B81_15000 [Sulfitobacter pontiacus]|uniref:tyrosine-type recombinase/integrase n=1 Tax=Sulfitobacter pontiacus TaxID=60137 RepID=UPI0007D974E6|nr:tyrosine-type recombinase/integrase [Sulfitobacter pontiacus]OAN77937.1 hypothetical protein A8B81_15000 [Sulfitobacter pontiacus]